MKRWFFVLIILIIIILAEVFYIKHRHDQKIKKIAYQQQQLDLMLKSIESGTDALQVKLVQIKIRRRSLKPQQSEPQLVDQNRIKNELPADRRIILASR